MIDFEGVPEAIFIEDMVPPVAHVDMGFVGGEPLGEGPFHSWPYVRHLMRQGYRVIDAEQGELRPYGGED